MGGNRASGRARASRALCAVLSFACAVAACGDDTESNVVQPAHAITAVVAWQADEQDPILDDNGEPQLPVIFLVAGEGTAIDVGVQAEVAAATTDWATVRFADDVSDTFDVDLEGEPVRDGGAMLLIGPIPEPARTIDLEVLRYDAVDDHEAFTLEITSDTPTDNTEGVTAPRASVTAVTQP